VRRILGCLGLIALFVAAVHAEGPDHAVVAETWDAAYLDGAQAGFLHTVTRRVQRDGRTLVQTTRDLNLNVERFHAGVRLRMQSGTEETPDGRVIAVFMRQSQGGQQSLDMHGTVEGDHLHVLVDGGKRLDRRVPWDEHAVGAYHEDRLFQERRVKPGDRFTYLVFEPTVTRLIRVRVAVGEEEETRTPGGTSKRLLRAELTSDALGGVQLPARTIWLDAKLVPVRSETEMPGLGKLTLVRTTRQGALAADTSPVQSADIGFGQLIPLSKRILRPHERRTAVYRITLTGQQDASGAFAQDERQQVRNLHGSTFEIHVHALPPSEPPPDARSPGPEYRQSSFFITSDDARVRNHAARAVGDEADDWEKARRIERWVHAHMTSRGLTEELAPADRVARTLAGDCTEYAMLAAAMCRAVGVPSRIAVGLIYVNSAGSPKMGFHMWTEVWAHGRWLAIDATLARDFVDATHLKIADHSWHNTQSLAPLFPVLRVLGKISIDVLEVDGLPLARAGASVR
jgi:hypothetical protein